jgi:hypothetical protein
MANRPRSPGSVEVRRPSRAVSLDDARNPEVGGSNADRELLEGLFMDATEGGMPWSQRFMDWVYVWLQQFEEERGRQERVGREASERYPEHVARDVGSGSRKSPGGRYGFTSLTGPYTHTGPRLRD